VAQKGTQSLSSQLQQEREKSKRLETELEAQRYKWELLFQKKGTLRTERLRLRCSKETADKFKAFIVEGSFETQEDGLEWLLQRYVEQAFNRGTNVSVGNPPTRSSKNK
jgi:hypothetical protein